MAIRRYSQTGILGIRLGVVRLAGSALVTLAGNALVTLVGIFVAAAPNSACIPYNVVTLF